MKTKTYLIIERKGRTEPEVVTGTSKLMALKQYVAKTKSYRPIYWRGNTPYVASEYTSYEFIAIINK